MAASSKISGTGKILLYLFFALSFTNLWAEYQINHSLIYITKPLLVSLLAIFFYLENKEQNSRFRNLILAALVFSVFGDTFLMFVEQNPEKPYFFILGLGSFLIAHLFYMTAFLTYPSAKTGYIKRKPQMVIPFLIFLVSFNTYLYPAIPIALKVPVLLYSLAIVAMSLSAVNLNGKISDKSFVWLLCGVLLFVFSDTIIGLNKFMPEAVHWVNPRILIMSTYLAAQLLITYACLKANKAIC
jgi:uncharacterized membrane protein YhhN